jgi:hypothetical protein
MVTVAQIRSWLRLRSPYLPVPLRWQQLQAQGGRPRAWPFPRSLGPEPQALPRPALVRPPEELLPAPGLERLLQQPGLPRQAPVRRVPGPRRGQLPEPVLAQQEPLRQRSVQVPRARQGQVLPRPVPAQRVPPPLLPLWAHPQELLARVRPRRGELQRRRLQLRQVLRPLAPQARSRLPLRHQVLHRLELVRRRPQLALLRELPQQGWLQPWLPLQVPPGLMLLRRVLPP